MRSVPGSATAVAKRLGDASSWGPAGDQAGEFGDRAAAVDLGDVMAVAQYGDAVADARDLIEFGRDEQHGHAVGGQIAYEFLDLGLGADIDAAGGLVEDEQRRLGDQPAGQQHLLLVAAAEVLDGRVRISGPDVEHLHIASYECV